MQKGSELSTISEPEEWATCMVRCAATALLATNGNISSEMRTLIGSLVEHDIFRDHMRQMGDSAAVLVLKAASTIRPDLVASPV